MRGFIIIAVLAVAVQARPEPPRNGYNYAAPAPPPVIPAPLPAPAPIQSVNSGFASSGSGGYVNGGYQQNSGFASNFQQPPQNFAPQQNFQSQQSFQQPQQNFQQSFQPQPQPQTIVQKHIYVHVPPPEEEYEQQALQQSYAAPRKHYKIIFIKAPSAPTISQQLAAAQAQNQEKTLIYVLVKKPEEFSAGSVAAPAPDLPVSKPEVYFIKYKTQKQQAQAQTGAVSGGQSFAGGDYSSGGQSITDYQAPNPASAYGPPNKK